jgi:hypothetical protein
VPIFAAGNAGPAAGSVGSPAGYPEAVAVGAIDSNDAVPSFSGRGPVVWQNADGLGPDAGTVIGKPDLAAPGVGITSSSGSGYLSYSGTSMAAPHVAGVAALLRQANPALSAQSVADILRMSADDIGAPGVDPNSGFGRLDALRAVESAVGPAPDTRLTGTPPAVTNARPLVYGVAVTGGATAVRTRVDGGAWSAPVAPGAVPVDVPEGKHIVEAQAIDPAGVVDPTPARHAVTVDRTGPRIAIGVRRSGTAMTFRSTVKDSLSGAVRGTIRWSFGEGQIARGGTVTRRFAEGGRRRVVLTARDAAGNESYVARTIAPRAASAMRALKAPGAASRRGGALTVRGRLVRPATVRVTLRRVNGAGIAASAGLAASFTAPRLSSPIRRAAVTGREGGFRARVRVAGLRPGLYRLEVRAAERGTTLGRLAISRRIEIR